MVANETINVDDIVANHFRCIDMVIDQAAYVMTEKFIGGVETVAPEQVHEEIQKLLKSYNQSKTKTMDEILDFHVRFERIHPFKDGNGRVGRLLLLKECLKNNVVPFIIDESLKMFYYRGLHEWNREKGYLRDTCLTAQDQF